MALEHAHGLKILHRDVKPQNILMERRGHVKLTDLGLARAAYDATDDRKDSIMGTPHYLPPEVAQHRKYDRRSDIYSLGATFFQIVTGRVPYEGESSLAVIAKHVNERVPNARDVAPSVPEPVSRLIERMMAKDPAMRPASAGELIQAIEEIQALGIPDSPAARPDVVPPSTGPGRRRLGGPP